MALKMPKLFGEAQPKPVASEVLVDMPTTQVKLGASAPAGYDPLASVSVMEKLRESTNRTAAPWKLPLLGAMPVAKQLSVLGTLFGTMVVLALLMIMLDNRAASQGAAATATAAEMQMLSQRLARGAVLAAQGNVAAFAAVRDSRERFSANLDAFLNGGEVHGRRLDVVQDPGTLEQLNRIKERWARADAAAARLVDNQSAIVALKGGEGAGAGNVAVAELAREAVRTIDAEAEPLLKDTTTLAAVFEGGGVERTFTFWTAVVLGVLALASLVLIGKVYLDDSRVRAQESEQENKRNQEAILRLLNEMGNLADGDLTVQASVTEDVTGAIADSINFTIEELRTLVRGINSATDQVTKATQETQSISNRLFEASQRQNREIQQASNSVLQMAQSISEVAQTASASAKVAQQSLGAAEKGGHAVRNQIEGMNDIRTQIQDTSKRIKRLGESSLEIGEIVELISDITEQTNVLALNAAIQAASAGEAGRGFTVVAEEVQRLAERSGEATKQIDAIVKTIQADTQDAVAAMEKSTMGVVEGAKLSDAAGQALTEIEEVSRELAELIARISAQTQMQSASVSEVTTGMQGILRITEETTEGTKQTNVSIGQLTRLAAELRSSVAGFKV
jgi:twitching motility protein PilJ